LIIPSKAYQPPAFATEIIIVVTRRCREKYGLLWKRLKAISHNRNPPATA
jgi:hypothetical protein